MGRGFRSLDQRVEDDGLGRLRARRRLGFAADAAAGEETGKKEADKEGAEGHGARIRPRRGAGEGASPGKAIPSVGT